MNDLLSENVFMDIIVLAVEQIILNIWIFYQTPMQLPDVSLSGFDGAVYNVIEWPFGFKFLELFPDMVLYFLLWGMDELIHKKVTVELGYFLMDKGSM